MKNERNTKQVRKTSNGITLIALVRTTVVALCTIQMAMRVKAATTAVAMECVL